MQAATRCGRCVGSMDLVDPKIHYKVSGSIPGLAARWFTLLSGVLLGPGNRMVPLASCTCLLLVLSTALGCSLAGRSASETVKADMSPGSMDDGAGFHSKEDNACPARVLRRFIVLARQEAFEDVRSLLAAELRVRYDVESLRADYEEAGSELQETLDQMERALLDGGLMISREEDEALLPLGAGRAVRLVRETKGWRVGSLQ